jgi:hypothetical protein
MLPWTQVITVSYLLFQPPSSSYPFTSFLNLHPQHYGIYIVHVHKPRKVLCWHRDVGKTIIIQYGPYRGAHFTIGLGKLFRYSIQPEFIPMVTGSPKSWIPTLLSDLTPLLQHHDPHLIQQLASSIQTPSSSSSSSLIMTTTGKRPLQTSDLPEWEYIKQAIKLIYNMTQNFEPNI